MVGKLFNYKILFFILLIRLSLPGFSQTNPLSCESKELIDENIEHYHIQDSTNNYRLQNIHILRIPLHSLGTKYDLLLASSDSTLHSTSYFAQQHNAIAAINGGFFDVRKGGSISYIEESGKKTSIRSMRVEVIEDEKSNINGAVSLSLNAEVLIGANKPSDEFLQSEAEKWILTTGPLLLHKGERQVLLDGSFSTKRHPRSCLGKDADYLYFITVDGRHKKALGMTLIELQDFVYSLGCQEAVNLDGGGSTTLWAQGSQMPGSVLNCPSDNKRFDKAGERKVANAIILKKSNRQL